jgi:outer membrane protein insertion porin family
MAGVRRGFIAFLFSAGLALACAGFSPALAQMLPGANGLLTSARATGSKRFSSSQVVALSGLHAGEPVTLQDLQNAANRLAQLGLFSEVRYRYASEGPNVSLDFEVADAPSFPITFDNFPWFTDKEIVQALEAALPAYDGMAPQDGAYLDQVSQALAHLVATRHVQGTIEHRLVRDPLSDQMLMQFRVAGPSLPVARVQFSDPLATQDQHVRDRLSDLVGKPFSRFTVELFALEQVRPVYWEHGYLRARFGQPEARFFGNPNAPPANQVMVILPIEPGPVYHWAGAAWTGNSVFDAASLEQMIGLRRGDVANGMTIEGAWDRIRGKYGSEGYLDMQLAPVASYDDAHDLVRYQVAIQEGTQYRMGQLVVTGLSLEAERRLRQTWQVHPGQPFDKLYFDEFLRNIVKEAFAGLSVHYAKIGHWLQRNREAKTVDVMLDFE